MAPWNSDAVPYGRKVDPPASTTISANGRDVREIRRKRRNLCHGTMQLYNYERVFVFIPDTEGVVSNMRCQLTPSQT